MIPIISVYFDGTVGTDAVGAESAAGAFAVFKNDSLVHKQSFMSTAQSPAQAEFTAAIEALSWLLDNQLFKMHVRLHGDNLETIRQLTGIWEVPPPLAQLYAETMNLTRKFKDLSFGCVTFKKNELAVELAERELIKNGFQPIRLALKATKSTEIA